MAARVIEQTRPSGVAAPVCDRGTGYCPECGQSLDLARRRDGVVLQRAAGRWPVAVVGLCLILLFGFRTWQAHDTLVGLDREIAGSRAAMAHDVFGPPSNQAVVQAETVSPLLPDRAQLRQQLTDDLTGLALGLIALAAGAGGWNRSLVPIMRRPGQGHVAGQRASHPLDALVGIIATLAGAGNALAGSFVQVLLILFGYFVAAQLVRGGPSTLDLLDQALARTVEIVSTVGRMLG
jgi:hypothetical protein